VIDQHSPLSEHRMVPSLPPCVCDVAADSTGQRSPSPFPSALLGGDKTIGGPALGSVQFAAGGRTCDVGLLAAESKNMAKWPMCRVAPISYR
jgi:hypothetical protein